MPLNFERNIFINCPFDEDYRGLLMGIAFTIIYFGYEPRLTLENVDSAEARINKILKLVSESKFGIHDISRMVSANKGEYYRINMPFELGIDFGCKKLKGGKWAKKKILILEKEKFGYQKAISDLSGFDIKYHENEVMQVVFAVRDWIIVEELKNGDSGKKVWDSFNEFHAYLHDVVIEKEGHESVDEIQISEIIHHMKDWFKYKSN